MTAIATVTRHFYRFHPENSRMQKTRIADRPALSMRCSSAFSHSSTLACELCRHNPWRSQFQNADHRRSTHQPHKVRKPGTLWIAGSVEGENAVVTRERSPDWHSSCYSPQGRVLTLTLPHFDREDRYRYHLEGKLMITLQPRRSF